MKILVACDSFKGTLTSLEIGKTIKEELEKKNHQVDFIAISDGGEGFLDVIEQNIKCEKYFEEVPNAIGNLKKSCYLYSNNTVYIELAEVVGIKDLKDSELKPFNANTYGMGLITKLAILKHHPKQIVFGLGGSASTDGGSGFLEALGARFYSNDQLVTSIDNEKLASITSVDLTEVVNLTKDINALVLTDVSNPLLGEKGAANIFGPQKGASKEDVFILDNNLRHFTEVLNKEALANYPGAGAAGGTTFGIMNAFDTNIALGIKYLLELVDFKNLVNQYDLIITGEGKFDEQSKMGKVFEGISSTLTDIFKLKVICALNDTNDDFVYAIVPNICSKEESFKDPKGSLIKLIAIESLLLYPPDNVLAL